MKAHFLKPKISDLATFQAPAWWVQGRKASFTLLSALAMSAQILAAFFVHSEGLNGRIWQIHNRTYTSSVVQNNVLPILWGVKLTTLPKQAQHPAFTSRVSTCCLVDFALQRWFREIQKTDRDIHPHPWIQF